MSLLKADFRLEIKSWSTKIQAEISNWFPALCFKFSQTEKILDALEMTVLEIERVHKHLHSHEDKLGLQISKWYFQTLT